MPALPISWKFVPDQGLHIWFSSALSPTNTPGSPTEDLGLGCIARLDANAKIESLTIPQDRLPSSETHLVCRYDREVDCLCVNLTGEQMKSASTHACFNERVVFDCVGDKIGAIEVLFVSSTCCWEQ